ncbi:hypothetical protein F4801DRAFT_586967 [Xylaria longipes]|nr:hypothetical protein F4801DRAFT_586967 [Xylaria longipes]
MEELDASLRKLDLSSRNHTSFGNDGVPFQPSGHLAAKLGDTPRYLFRVFSKTTRGENTNDWVRSGAAIEGKLGDIFERNDASKVAITLNEHLRWCNPNGDPFMSWTTSLAFAIQYAIYKGKMENAELQTIQLCIVDTTKFPRGVFARDLDLIEEFEDKVPEHQLIEVKGKITTWKHRGLGNLHWLRRKKHETFSGFYYFGEYLSQGQMNIKGRSCTVSCNKIINNHLFTLAPLFRIELESAKPEWANAVINLREPFYTRTSQNAEGTEPAHLIAAMMISLEFAPNWFIPMFANLLSLSPRCAQDQGICGVIICVYPSRVRRLSLSRETKVIADENIPEVQQFSKIVRDIGEDGTMWKYYVTVGKFYSLGILVRFSGKGTRFRSGF